MSAGTAAHVRLYSRNATGRAIGGIAVTAELIEAKNSTIDGDSCARAAGLSRLEKLFPSGGRPNRDALRLRPDRA
jgi:hypothetical protein